jgi:hypothetical protein
LTIVETIKAGKGIYKATDKAAQVGMDLLPTLPPLAVEGSGAADSFAHDQPPRRGIFAYAGVPGPCGCAGCALGHLVTMGRREVASNMR